MWAIDPRIVDRPEVAEIVARVGRGGEMTDADTEVVRTAIIEVATANFMEQLNCAYSRRVCGLFIKGGQPPAGEELKATEAVANVVAAALGLWTAYEAMRLGQED